MRPHLGARASTGSTFAPLVASVVALSTLLLTVRAFLMNKQDQISLDHARNDDKKHNQPLEMCPVSPQL